MKVPTISHETWEWTRGLAHFAVDTETVDADDLSFNDWVDALLAVEPIEQLEEEMDTDRYEYSHGHFDRGTTVTIYPMGDQDHRPEVDDRTAQALAEWVDGAHFSVSPSSLSFENQLRLLCENCEEYYNELGLYVQREGVDVDDIQDLLE